jgi:hypothetical protein
MTAGCGINHNHTIDIYRYNLNTQRYVILQISLHTVGKLLYLFIVHKVKKTLTNIMRNFLILQILQQGKRSM